MSVRNAKSRTADLFAAVPATLVPAAALAPSTPTKQPQAKQLQAKQLWYAVVFPELSVSETALATLQHLSVRAQGFTSFVSIELPDALLLEIRGSVKLFGSLPKLHADIDACWRRLGLTARSATTPSSLAALWLARAGSGVHGNDPVMLANQLSEVCIACTGWEGETLQTLRAMGIAKIGELLRLPRAGLARRFGPAMVQALDIALARQPAPRRAFVAKERFRACSNFEAEIENALYLQKALEPLIERCAQFLRKRQAGVQRLRLELHHRDGPSTRIELGMASITSEQRRLLDVAVQKLMRLELRSPVRGMELLSGSLRALSAASLDAFAAASTAGRDTVPQLVERLRARLGEEAVYGFCLIAEHRPEAAWRRVQELRMTSVRPAGAASSSPVVQGMPRPVWLLPEPLLWPKPDVLLDPERIESGWWDGKGVVRDYYVARGRHGPKLWVFQERRSKLWYLHGVFA